LPSHAVHIGSGLLFIGCAGLMWLRKQHDEAATGKTEEAAGFWTAHWTVFLVVFVAEWGDLTQTGTAGFEAKYRAWRSGPWQRLRSSSAIGRGDYSIPP